jgi:hypothetical protein
MASVYALIRQIFIKFNISLKVPCSWPMRSGTSFAIIHLLCLLMLMTMQSLHLSLILHNCTVVFNTVDNLGEGDHTVNQFWLTYQLFISVWDPVTVSNICSP